MKKHWILSVLVLLIFAVAYAAEDLGALAKKEKARREALAKEGKKGTVLTNADIPNIKSELAIQQTTPPPTEAAPAGEAAVTETAEPSEEGTASQELEQLKEDKARAEQEATEAREGVSQGGLYHGTGIGSQYQQVREAEKKSKELDEKIKEAEQKQAQEEADENE